MQREAIRVEPLSTYLECRQAPVTPVVRTGDTIYVSGFPPFDPDTGEVLRVALVHSAGPGIVGWHSLSGSSTPMPHKHNADRRRHIPKMSFKVRNWPAYEAGLRRRGSLTLWIEDAALGYGVRTCPERLSLSFEL